jgi:redox-sensing transcriptional repressor
MFDINPKVIGLRINDVVVQDADNLVDFLKENKVDIGIITTEKEAAQGIADRLVQGGVKGIWNFAPIDLVLPEGIALESVHLSDSLHALSFMIKRMNEDRD